MDIGAGVGMKGGQMGVRDDFKVRSLESIGTLNTDIDGLTSRAGSE